MEARRQDSDESILLPPEVIRSIFRLLSRKELKSLRTISRTWCELINPLVFDKVDIRCHEFIKRPLMYYYEAEVKAEHHRRVKRLAMETFDAMWGSNSTSAAVLGPLVRSVSAGAGFYGLDEILVLFGHCPGVNTLKLHTNMLQETQRQFREVQSADTQPFTALASFFAAMPRLTHVMIEGPALDFDFLIHAILPCLGSLRCLQLNRFLYFNEPFGPSNNISSNMQDGTDVGMHQLSKIQHACPDLTSLRFSLYTNEVLPASHRAGLDTACGVCMRPWLSVTCLALGIPSNWPTEKVPELLAYVCLKFPSLQILKMDTSSCTSIGTSHFGWRRATDPPIRAPTNAWRYAINTSIAHLVHLTTFEYIGSFVSVILDALHLFTTGSSAKRPSTLESLKISSHYEDSAVDPIDILAKFTSLRTLESDCHFDGWWAPNGNDPESIQVLLSRLPLSYHPLRTLILRRSTHRYQPVIAISKMCRDLTSVSFPGGVSMDLPADIADQLPVDALVQFDKATAVGGTVKWLPLPYSTRLKHVSVIAYASSVCLYLSTPKMPDDDVDDGTDASHNDRRAYGWFVKKKGSTSIPKKNKDIQPLGRDTSWVIDNVLFRPGQKQRQKDAGVASVAISAINAARRHGIVVILAPSQPQAVYLSTFRAAWS